MEAQEKHLLLMVVLMPAVEQQVGMPLGEEDPEAQVVELVVDTTSMVQGLGILLQATAVVVAVAVPITPH
jgi:hypothetical protein